MDALGPVDDCASPVSSTPGLDLRRLSVRDDSAYSSFSAASGGPELRTPSPDPEPGPYLDRDYVRVVWGGPGPPGDRPASVLRPRPPPALTGPRLAELQGSRGPLTRQATPLLFALAAEAQAAARSAEPPSPPAARAAYRQRLQGAQRRVLRETSFQRRELRMSLPARLRSPAAYPRSALLSHPVAAVERTGCGIPGPGSAGPGRLASQQRDWCLLEPPGDLDRLGQVAGPARKNPAGARSASASGLIGPEHQGLPQGTECQGHQVGWLAGTPLQGAPDGDLGSSSLREAYKSASPSQSASGEGLSHCGGPGGVIPNVQAIPQGAGPPRPLCQVGPPRFLSQEVVAGMGSVKDPRDSSASCEQKMPAWLPSLLDDDAFLAEAPPSARRGVSQDSCALRGLLASAHVSAQQNGADPDQRASQATGTAGHPLHEAGADSCWQAVSTSVGDSRVTCCHPSGPANGDSPTIDPAGLLVAQRPALVENDSHKPLRADVLGPPCDSNPSLPGHMALAWSTGKPSPRPAGPGRRLEELVQELARLDPSLSDTLTAQPGPEPSLDVFAGLIPLAEVWAAMRPACGDAGEVAARTPESRSCQATAQEETSPEHPTSHSVPDQSYGQAPPEPTDSIQAKKVELADILHEMLRDLHVERERLRGAAQACARRSAALESAVGRTCAPRELERFRGFMADLERVLGLLLLLGSRLARVHCALVRMGSNGDPEERVSLLQRLRLLQRQQEDAKELKEHVARRERALREVLGRTLAAKELRAYCGLLASKAALLARQRSLDERIRLLQDQLDVISSDLGHGSLSSRPAWPPGSLPPDKPPFPGPFI